MRLAACLPALLLAACGESPAIPAPGPGRAWARAATVALEIVGRDAQGPWIAHGAGTLLHAAGYVLTCEHVTAPGERQHVVLADGRRLPFRIVARAGRNYDLAVLAFDAPPDLPEIELGRSDTLAAGDDVLLVGNPAGRGLTTLSGIVDLPDCGGSTQIQVRAADVLPGYSGGPVLDRHGRQVAHIHVAIRTAQGVSRHIKIDHARDAFATWLDDERRDPHALGLHVDCHGATARVLAVAADSPAACAGIAVGDVITQAGRLVVRHGIHWVLAALDRSPAQPLELTLRRGPDTRVVTLVPPRAR